MKIVLDTDFLLNVVRDKIDLMGELERICDFRFELYFLMESVQELKGKRDGKLAKELIKKLNIKVIKESLVKNKNVDDLLFEMQDMVIATQDGELKDRLKNKGSKVITIRQKKHLVFV